MTTHKCNICGRRVHKPILGEPFRYCPYCGCSYDVIVRPYKPPTELYDAFMEVAHPPAPKLEMEGFDVCSAKQHLADEMEVQALLISLQQEWRENGGSK